MDPAAPPPTPSPLPRSRWRASLRAARRWGWLAIPVAAALAAGAGIGLFLALQRGLPQVEQLQTYEPSTVTTMLAEDGTPFATFCVERRYPVPLSAVPQDLVHAVVSVEDSRFFAHGGLDWKGIGRALWQDLRHRRVVEGGSTITQQLAKVLFLTPEKSFSRKLREALLALDIERRYGKEEILSLYLNQVYLGEGAYGVEAAAQTYFGKGVAELSLPECAMIAGLPRSPVRYSPISHPDAARARMKVVLRRLVEEGYATPEAARAAGEAVLEVHPGRAAKEPVARTGQWFAELVRNRLEENVGENLLYRGGLTVRTTLDLGMQRAAEAAVAEGIAAFEKRHPPRPGEPGVQAALLAMDPATGAVKALVGGRDFAASPYDRAVQARRQPGSAFKPILYAAALTAGMTPATILSDVPMTVRQPGSPPWSPQNYRGVFNGRVTLRTALENSLNAASVDLLLRTGYQPVIDAARRLGLTGEMRPYPSLALGVFDCSLAEMVAAYAAFENGGILPRPRTLRSAMDRDGIIREAGDPPVLAQALPPAAAFQVTNLLLGVVDRGTGKGASSLGLPLAGKTGTTDDYKDAWFIGFSPTLVAGVWVGFDAPRSLGRGEAGARAALPIWTRFMGEVLGGSPPSRYGVPPGIELVEVDPVSGLLAGEGCTSRIEEGFLPGTAPAETCSPDRHPAALTETPLD